MTTTIDLLEGMWKEADEDANTAIDAGDLTSADRAVTRQEIIADLIDNLKETKWAPRPPLLSPAPTAMPLPGSPA